MLSSCFLSSENMSLPFGNLFLFFQELVSHLSKTCFTNCKEFFASSSNFSQLRKLLICGIGTFNAPQEISRMSNPSFAILSMYFL